MQVTPSSGPVVPVPQSFFFYPLGTILGSEAAVRILRVLVRLPEPLSAPGISQRTGLSRAWVLRVLGDLLAAGVVEALGQGRSILYHLRDSHPLAGELRALFGAEAARVDHVLEAVRQAATSIEPRPDAVWLIGSVARGEDTAASDFDLAVVFPGTHVDAAADRLRDALAVVAETHGITPSVVPLDHADVRRLAAGDPFWRAIRRDAIPLVGPPPETLVRRLLRMPTEVSDG